MVDGGSIHHDGVPEAVNVVVFDQADEYAGSPEDGCTTFVSDRRDEIAIEAEDVSGNKDGGEDAIPAEFAVGERPPLPAELVAATSVVAGPVVIGVSGSLNPSNLSSLNATSPPSKAIEPLTDEKSWQVVPIVATATQAGVRLQLETQSSKFCSLVSTLCLLSREPYTWAASIVVPARPELVCTLYVSPY